MVNRMQLYDELLELSVRLRIDGALELAELINQTARCVLMERETAGAAALRRASDQREP